MKAFETLTISGTSTPLTAGIYSKNNGLECANKATISVETASLRYRVDGSAPTATVGLLANDGDVITLLGRNEIKLFRAIRVGVDSKITVDYGTAIEQVN